MMKTDDPHVKLLSPKEYSEQYDLPRFHAAERDFFFALNDKEIAAMQQFSHLKTRVFFILQLGYFRDKQQFFNFSLKDVKGDVKFILKHYFNTTPAAAKPSPTLGEAATAKQRQLILDLCEYEAWSNHKHQKMALEYLVKLVRRNPKGQDTFREFIAFLEDKRLTIPSYRTVQDLFTATFSQERARLDKQLERLTPEQQVALDHLLDNEKGLGHLNNIRYDQPDFYYQSLQLELEKVALLAPLYPFTQTFIPNLALSRNAVRYYASIAEQYPAARLRKLSKTQQSFYLLCFIHHRYQEFMDNLITSFLYYVKDFRTLARKAASEASDAYYKALKLEFPDLAKFLSWNAASTPSSTLSAADFQQAGFDILARDKQQHFAQYLLGQTFDEDAVEWAYYAEHSRKLALYLRPILLAVPLTYHKKDGIFYELLTALHEYYANGGTPKYLLDAFSIELLDKLPKKIRPYLLKPSDDATFSRGISR